MLDPDTSTDDQFSTSPSDPAPPEAPAETTSGATSGATDAAPEPESPEPKKKTQKKAAAKKTAAKKSAKKSASKTAETDGDTPEPKKAAAKKTAAKKSAKKSAAKSAEPADESGGESGGGSDDGGESAAAGAPAVLFQAPPKKTAKKAAKKSAKKTSAQAESGQAESAAEDQGQKSDQRQPAGADEPDESGDESGDAGNRRRRRRGGRRRRKPSDGRSDAEGSDDSEDSDDDSGDQDDGDEGQSSDSPGSRRRRRRRRPGESGDSSPDDPQQTTTRVRKQRNPEDEITSVSGSTRLEAKKQRRREGREAGRRRAPIVSEAEFLARRESVDRVMVIRQRDDLTQIAVLEDKVLVEHYVARESQTSLIGNVYLGRVQNVLPSMEAAFIDIGKGRNAVLYAGEVNWAALGHKDGQPRKIESVLSSGQSVLVQVTKDPIGHKGARLTSQVSLPGRFLVYVPEGNTSGISRKLPDTERNRLKTLLKEIVPDTAGVIVRTAAEGASEEELTHDVERLTARWSDIEEKIKGGKSPQLLYGEPDLTLKVVRDLFTEDFGKLVVQGQDAWDLVDGYVSHVAPDLRERLERFDSADGDADGEGTEGAAGSQTQDVFASYRIDEQIAKGLDRKVWLPSGGSLIIDRTEAMTVVDVNTGKFTGSGGNLEETVTKNNLEAAEEMVRQLRLRDIGGIIVVDFIDMVLESNRDLVLRRLVECLGRDRTRHQVAEVTSLGLVQMTRKRIGTGLLEAFSSDCEHCKGRGVVVHDHPVESGARSDDDEPRGRRARGGRNRGRSGSGGASQSGSGGRGNGGASGRASDDNDNGNGNGRHPSPADLAGSRPPVKQDDEDDQTEPFDESAPPATADQGEGGEQVQESEPRPEPKVIGSPADNHSEPVEVPSAEGSDQSGEPDAPAAAEEPAAPRVVTSTRRRSARRPAGPPAPSEETSMPGAGTQAGPAAEPVDIPVDPGGGTEPDSRSGADPDALAVNADQDDASEQDGSSESDESGGSGGPLSLLHVPVKRKGRKR